MLPPDVVSVIRDSENKVTYKVLAYRKLSRAEMVEQVAAFHAQPKVRGMKKPLRDKTFTVITLLGATD